MWINMYVFLKAFGLDKLFKNGKKLFLIYFYSYPSGHVSFIENK